MIPYLDNETEEQKGRSYFSMKGKFPPCIQLVQKNFLISRSSKE